MIDPSKYVRVKSKKDGKVYRFYGTVTNTTNPANCSVGYDPRMAVYKINSDTAAQGGDKLFVVELREFNQTFEFI